MIAKKTRRDSRRVARGRAKRSAKRTTPSTTAGGAFAHVVDALAKEPRVTAGGGKGFGSGALKVNGRIFAMMSSKGEFVVKLPEARVDELVTAGYGERFDPGRGRRMKEWLAVHRKPADWVDLAAEACRFVRASR